MSLFSKKKLDDAMEKMMQVPDSRLWGSVPSIGETAEQYMQRLSGVGIVPTKPSPVDLNKLAALKSSEPRKVAQRMPDGVTPITAWRAWKVDESKPVPQLAALGGYGAWEPRKAIEATCKNDGIAGYSFAPIGMGAMAQIALAAAAERKQHQAPCRDCTCGIWAFTTLEGLIDALDGYKPRVIGMVSMWGRIIECVKGFRAQFAYPKELWLLDNSLEQLGYVYNVPIRTH